MRPETIHQDKVAVVRGRIVVGALQSNVAGRGGHETAAGSGWRCETHEPAGRLGRLRKSKKTNTNKQTFMRRFEGRWDRRRDNGQ